MLKLSGKLWFYFTVLGGAVFLLIPAIYNGFPIVTSDSGAYLFSSSTLDPPTDRPLVYSIVIRVCSLWGNLIWGPVIFQCYMMSWLLVKITQKALILYRHWHALSFILFLSVSTGIAWTASELMCDIFTSAAALCIILLLSGTETITNKLILCILYYIAVATHASHFLLFTVLIIAVFLFSKIILHAIPRRFAVTLLIFLTLTLATYPAIQYPVSRSGHVFFMGAMIEHGITKKFLDEYCPTERYQLCAYKNQLPSRAFLFLWDFNNSPLYKLGGWDSTRDDFNRIIYATLTRPKYIGIHIKASLESTFHQLISFGIADGNVALEEGSLPFSAISNIYPSQLSAYIRAKQNTLRFQDYTPKWDLFFGIVVILSCILLLLLSFKKELYTRTLGLTFFICLLSIIINAWDCGTFANVINRLGCKMIWMVPFCALLFLANLQTTLSDIKQKSK